MKPVKFGNLIGKSMGPIGRYLDQTEESRMEWISKRIKVSPWPREAVKVPKWQAHRGFWINGAPQNSLQAIAAARDQGAQMAEFDVRVTRDRIPILFHDEVLRDGDQSRPINTMTLRELKDQIPVTKLQDVLLSSRATEYFNIELKSEQVMNEPMERYVASVIEKYGVHNRILFSSFNPFSIWKMAQYLPRVPRALLVAPDMTQRSLREMWWSLVVPIHALHLDHQMISQNRMQQFRDQQVPIAAWTVNDVHRMEQLLEWGVFSVITDQLPPPSIRDGRIL